MGEAAASAHTSTSASSVPAADKRESDPHLYPIDKQESDPILHALLVPGPGLGHFNAALLLGKALVQAGFSLITIACFATSFAAYSSKIEAQMIGVCEKIRLEVVSDGIDPAESKGYGSLFSYTPHMKEALACFLRSLASATVGLPVTCIISDTFMAWTQDVAEALGIPRIENFTASATSYIILLAAPSFVSQGHVPLARPPTKWRSDPPELIDWVPGLPGFRLDDLPQNFTHLTDPKSDFFLKKCYEASARVKTAERVLIHSAVEFEKSAYDALATVYGVKAYATGPLVHYGFQSNKVSEKPHHHQQVNGADDNGITLVLKSFSPCNGEMLSSQVKICDGNHGDTPRQQNSGSGGDHSSNVFTYEHLKQNPLNGKVNGSMKKARLNQNGDPGYCNGGECINGKLKKEGLSEISSEEECLEWLDQQPEKTVIYVSFGSNVTLSAEEVIELALGIEASGQSFLWVLRTDHCESVQVLPAGFKGRTEGRGRIVAWAPQVAVLGHRAVGGFLSHCGWNSVLESVWEGVPMLGCPRAAEQRLNMRFVARDWGVGLEMERTDSGGLDRKFVEEGVKLLMVSNAGMHVREKAMHLARHLVHKYSCVSPALLDLTRDMRARIHSSAHTP